jgi:hypothetical protein
MSTETLVVGGGESARAALKFQLTQGVVVKGALSGIFGVLSIYFLAAGRKNNDPGKLFWAAFFGLAAFLVYCL